MPTIRIMTYNLHHGEGCDGQIDLPRIADVILAAHADVVACQEVDRGVPRSHQLDMMEELAALTNMTAVFGKNLDYQGGDYGNGLLVRYPVVRQANRHYQMIRPNEQRGLLHAVLNVEGHEVVVMSTHVDYRPDHTERLMNIREIEAVAQEHAPRPVIVCGDFNAYPDSPTICAMQQRFLDVWEAVGEGDGSTFPATQPARRIDYVFAVDAVRSDPHALVPTGAWTFPSLASDHLPLLAEFRLS